MAFPLSALTAWYSGSASPRIYSLFGSEDVDWRRRLGEPVPERSFGDKEREDSEGRLKPMSGDRFAAIWGREPAEALL